MSLPRPGHNVAAAVIFLLLCTIVAAQLPGGDVLPPSDPACSTVQPGPAGSSYCPAMLSADEVLRGFGAYYDPACPIGTGGSWAVYTYPGGSSCCRTCRWNRDTAVAAWMQPTELPNCPACVQAYYESIYNGSVPIVPLSSVVAPERCPFPRFPDVNTSLPGWLYNPDTDKCYFKSTSASYSVGVADAASRCATLGASLLKVSSAGEDDFVRLNLLWTGQYGECYTGLRKSGNTSPGFNNTWYWPDGAPLLATDYQRWGSPSMFTQNGPDDLCMEYLPQQPKSWNPFSCAVIKNYICNRPAVAPGTVIPSPSPAPAPATPSPTPIGASPAPSVPSCTPPAPPAVSQSTVLLVNAGGPAICGLTADTATAPQSTGGIVENWVVPGNPSCAACATAPTLNCTACTVRFGGTFSYTFNTTAGRMYDVRTTFSEVWWTTAGGRRLDVLVDGVPVLTGIDPYALAGARFVPVARDFTVTAATGSMTVTFQATVDNAILAALEVYDIGAAPAAPSPSPAPAVTSPAPAVASPNPSPASPAPASLAPASPAPAFDSGVCPNQPANSTLVARLNCGGPALSYPTGCTWSADTAATPFPGRTGGFGINAPTACSPDTNPGGPIACSDRWGGVINYTFPVTPGAAYQVIVHMAETYWTGTSPPTPGSRMCRIYINGQLRTSGINPYTAAGLPGARFTPALFSYTTLGPAAGTLFVTLDATADQPSVVGIEVYNLQGNVSGLLVPSPSPAPVLSPSPAAVASPSPAPAPVILPPPGHAPTDPACSTVQPPYSSYCPAMLTADEVLRGFGAYYDPACPIGTGGSWAVYTYPGGSSCCRTCRWNRDTAVAAWMQPTELPNCPACVQAYYESAYNGSVPLVPLSSVVAPERCPFPRFPDVNTSLPGWLYNPATDKCYFKSTSASYSVGVADAASRCATLGASLLKVSSAGEDDFVRLNLLWTGQYGECYTGLRKSGNTSPGFNNTWYWPDGAPLLATDYQRWGSPSMFTQNEPDDLCMEYLPQQPKSWNPFSCAVIKNYICNRPAVAPGTVIPSPSPAPAPATPSPTPIGASPAPSVPSCTPPAPPAGSLSTVLLVNAGGPAICGLTADTATAPQSTGGIAENWVVPGNPSCAACATAPTLNCTACTVRFGGTFSYTFSTTAGRMYNFRTTFSEVWWTTAGGRRLDVLVDGAPVLTGIDPYALAGARFVPVARDFTVTAATGSMTVTFQATVDNAILAALEVYEMA